MKIAVLYSGGFDSLVLYQYARVQHPEAEVSCVFWAHGHKQSANELRSLPSFADVRHVDWLDRPVSGGYRAKQDANGAIYVPGRNLALAVLTACQELPDEVWIGALVNEAHAYATDKNALFSHTASAAISYALSPFLPLGVRVRAPLVEASMDKEGAFRWALDHGLRVEDLAATWSCFEEHAPGTDPALPCGNCQKCLHRFALFRSVGRPDAERYALPPLSPGAGRDYLLRLLTAAEAAGWRGPEAQDCMGFLRHLAPHIRQNLAHDLALQRAADLLEADRS